MKKDHQPETSTNQARQNEHAGHWMMHMQQTLNYHELMLSDRLRNQTFYNALKRHVKKDVSVLDIGSGTGIWAIAAAKLGASRVVAIEKERMLIPIIEKLASKNDVSDRVEVLEGDSREVAIAGKFDLIITETVGNEGFDEGIVPTIIDARKRFLKKSGVVIPHEVAAIAAPAHLKGKVETLPAGLELDYRYFESLNRDIPKKIGDRKRMTLLGKPVTLAHVDLNTVTKPPTLSEMNCKWRLKDASRVNCLVVWARVLLTKGISVDTIRHTEAWNPICLSIDPLAAGPATIECRVTISNRHYYWVVSRNDKRGRTVQSHSPIFPYTSLQTAGKFSR
ncbi:MAG TPA: 50S ribosomal protein L11 methyltransferase [Pyrinomonadaceae bacterium]|nr:50S ribosomal protein L11 methyltransferase [Pyrinomonadaceae bacterium]